MRNKIIEPDSQLKNYYDNRYFSELTSILDLAPNSITIHNYEGKFLYANKKTFELHGYTPDEFLAINLYDLDIPQSEKLITERVDYVIENGESIFEVFHYRKDRSVLPLEIIVKQVEWEGKVAFINIATDISSKKESEKLINKYLKV